MPVQVRPGQFGRFFIFWRNQPPLRSRRAKKLYESYESYTSVTGKSQHYSTKGIKRSFITEPDFGLCRHFGKAFLFQDVCKHQKQALFEGISLFLFLW